jgi:hypothetical protein
VVPGFTQSADILWMFDYLDGFSNDVGTVFVVHKFNIVIFFLCILATLLFLVKFL